MDPPTHLRGVTQKTVALSNRRVLSRSTELLVEETGRLSRESLREYIREWRQQKSQRLLLPTTRVKRIMKTTVESKKISFDAPLLMSKLCEMVIADLAFRAKLIVNEGRRKTIQKYDILNAIARTDLFDFSIDFLPQQEMVKIRKDLFHESRKTLLSASTITPSIEQPNIPSHHSQPLLLLQMPERIYPTIPLPNTAEQQQQQQQEQEQQEHYQTHNQYHEPILQQSETRATGYEFQGLRPTTLIIHRPVAFEYTSKGEYIRMQPK